MANQSGATKVPPTPALPKKERVPSKQKWVIGDKEFVQDELSFIEKGELFELFADGIDQALDRGMPIGQIVELARKVDLADVKSDDVAEIVGTLFEESGENAEDFLKELLQTVLRVVRSVPGATPKIIMLSLSISEENRYDFERGPLREITDDVGFGILVLFRKQNLQALVDFGRRWWVDVISPAASSSEALKSEVSQTSSE